MLDVSEAYSYKPHRSASSVDAERAFSGSRLQVGHLQHGISSQTFKAQMAVGSWIGTPLMPDITHPTNILQARMTRKGVENGGSGLGGVSAGSDAASGSTVN
jgi:hypothetical protein